MATAIVCLGVLACHDGADTGARDVRSLHRTVPTTALAFTTDDFVALRAWDGDATYRHERNILLDEPVLRDTPAERVMVSITDNAMLFLDADGQPTAPPDLATAEGLVTAGKVDSVGSIAERFAGAPPTVRTRLRREATRVFGCFDELACVQLASAVRGGVPGDPSTYEQSVKTDGGVVVFNIDGTDLDALAQKQQVVAALAARAAARAATGPAPDPRAPETPSSVPSALR